MNKNITLTLLMALALVGMLSLTACGASTPEPTPTIDVAPIQTDAVSTFAAGLTQTAFLQPTETPTSTSTPTPASTPTPGTPVPPAGGLVPTASCYGLIFRQDVTIPDNTAMVPGQTFTKTWKVRNSGSCAWDSGFKLISTGGAAMGGTAKTLGQSVAPGAEIDISVPMTAPNKTGSVRGNWRGGRSRRRKHPRVHPTCSSCSTTTPASPRGRRTAAGSTCRRSTGWRGKV